MFASAPCCGRATNARKKLVCLAALSRTARAFVVSVFAIQLILALFVIRVRTISIVRLISFLVQCPNLCSGFGTCDNETYTCTCDETHYGDDCSQSLYSSCEALNNADARQRLCTTFEVRVVSSFCRLLPLHNPPQVLHLLPRQISLLAASYRH